MTTVTLKQIIDEMNMVLLEILECETVIAKANNDTLIDLAKTNLEKYKNILDDLQNKMYKQENNEPISGKDIRERIDYHIYQVKYNDEHLKELKRLELENGLLFKICVRDKEHHYEEIARLEQIVYTTKP